MKISTEQNVLQNPLNVLLGSKASIRLLRVLCHEVGEPLSAADAAKRAGLTAVGARKALARLVRSGFLVRIGGGKTKQYKLKDDDPLLSVLTALFREEEARYDTFLARLREVVLDIPELRSVWIDKMPTEPGGGLEVVVLTDAKALPWMREELRARLSPLERKLDQVIEIAMYTRADAPNKAHDALTLLAGEFPGESSRTESVPGLHSGRDERALRLSRGISKLIRTDPSIIKRALRHLDRLALDHLDTATADLLEWRQILVTYSPERLSEFLMSTTSRAARLRQSSPFFAVLNPDEREILMRDFEAEQ